jgi:hypothetical protein
MLQKSLLLLVAAATITACKTTWKPTVLANRYDTQNIPAAPNYTNPSHWCALPTKHDMADSLPKNSNFTDGQANAKADVFFVYPTIFTFAPKNQYQWNADVEDTELNALVDNSTILNQATAFNGSCKVYAPRYRQAHLYAYYTPNRIDGLAALDLAYQDIKTAFEYYLKNHNNGRPIVIASHSQGTTHTKRLMKEFFDGKPLQQQLVGAYLVGIATPANYFEHIKPISKPGEVGTFATWNTYAKDFYPNNYNEALVSATCTNPLIWNSGNDYADYSKNLGGVGQKFDYRKNLSDAQTHEGMLWIGKLNIMGAGLVKTKIWHKADINFFYGNIRANVAEQVDNFFRKK